MAKKVNSTPELDDKLPDEAAKTIVAPKGKESVTLKDFEIKSVIGRGSFGKVFLVALKNDQSEVFAMKSLGKNVILEYD